MSGRALNEKDSLGQKIESHAHRKKIESFDEALVTRVLTINSRCRRLNLSCNMITCDRIDEAALSRFSSMLVYLNLSSNLLEGELPRAFTVLQCLQALDLSRNNLADVKALTGLKSLKRLDLAHNKISRWDQLQALHESGLDLLTLRLEGNPVCSTLAGEKGEEQYSLLVKSLFPNIERIDDPESVGNHQHRFFGAAGHSGLGGGGRRGSDSAISVTSSSARTVYPSPPSPMLVDGGSDSSMFSDVVTRRSSLSATASLHAARAAISAAATTRSAGSSRAATPAFDAASNSDIKAAAKSVHRMCLFERGSMTAVQRLCEIAQQARGVLYGCCAWRHKQKLDRPDNCSRNNSRIPSIHGILLGEFRTTFLF